MSTQRRKRRFPMFLKFLLACLLLAGMLIFGGTMVVKDQSTLRSRGNFLVKHLRRYEFYQERVGKGMTGTVELLVGEPALRAAMTPPEPAAGPDPETVGAIGKGMFERLSSKNSVQPDLFAIFDVNGKLLYTAPGTSLDRDTSTVAAVEKARTGSSFMHRLQVLDATLYQATALPIRAAEPGQSVPTEEVTT